MVFFGCFAARLSAGVSVLALSSRFDGLGAGKPALIFRHSFSTRSVESF